MGRASPGCFFLFGNMCLAWLFRISETPCYLSVQRVLHRGRGCYGCAWCAATNKCWEFTPLMPSAKHAVNTRGHVYGSTGVKWMRLKRCKCFRMMEHIATILPVSSGRMAVLGRVVSCEHWYQLSHEFIPIAALLLNSNVSFLAKFILFPDPLIVALNTWPCNAL